MSSFAVVVLCPNGRREQVKVTPNTSVLEVLEAACKKQKINPEEFDICHYTRTLDVTLSVRFSNIPNNAMLTLVPAKKARLESSVTIGLQLESGDRIDSNFDPASSLWEVIEKCLALHGESLHESDVSGKEPVCIYMRQQFTGDVFKSTTLRNLGLTCGKAILRLMYRAPEAMHGQALIAVPFSKPTVTEDEPIVVERATSPKPNSMKTRNSYERESDESSLAKQARLEGYPEAPKTIIADPTKSTSFITKKADDLLEQPIVQEITSSTINQANTSSQESCEEMEVDSCMEALEYTDSEIGEIKYLGPRSALLFNLRDITANKLVDIPDDFFELTVNDVKYLMNEYKRVREDMENQPMMLKSQREAQLIQQLAQYKQTVIRIYFPNKFVLQGTFIADETVQAVMEFVQGYLNDKGLWFYLYTAPPKTELSPQLTLAEARLTPAAVVYFGCNGKCDSFLRPDVEAQISDPRAAKQAAEESRKKCVESMCDGTPAPTLILRTNERSIENPLPPPVIYPQSERTSNQRQEDSKMPKWFKFGK